MVSKIGICSHGFLDTDYLDTISFFFRVSKIGHHHGHVLVTNKKNVAGPGCGPPSGLQIIIELGNSSICIDQIIIGLCKSSICINMAL